MAELGTTNVDAPRREALARIGGDDPPHLAVRFLRYNFITQLALLTPREYDA